MAVPVLEMDFTQLLTSLAGRWLIACIEALLPAGVAN
jgi:hypothetical protein